MNEPHADLARGTAQQELLDAEADYQRFRSAFVQVLREEPGHAVAIAMVGADTGRAHARLGRLRRLTHAATATATAAAAAAIFAAAKGPMAQA